MSSLDKEIREAAQPIEQQLREDLNVIARPSEPQLHSVDTPPHNR
ncbi:hypothetical protein [Kitasatospora sp. NBC_01300]|nr:hypothetical protein OG556_35155 [Kitasatospora sp. NBC_01300]